MFFQFTRKFYLSILPITLLLLWSGLGHASEDILKKYQIVRFLPAEKRLVLKEGDQFLVLHEGDLLPKGEFRILRFGKDEAVLEKTKGQTKTHSGLHDLLFISMENGKLKTRLLSGTHEATPIPVSSSVTITQTQSQPSSKKEKH